MTTCSSEAKWSSALVALSGVLPLVAGGGAALTTGMDGPAWGSREEVLGEQELARRRINKYSAESPGWNLKEEMPDERERAEKDAPRFPHSFRETKLFVDLLKSLDECRQIASAKLNRDGRSGGENETVEQKIQESIQGTLRFLILLSRASAINASLPYGNKIRLNFDETTLDVIPKWYDVLREIKETYSKFAEASSKLPRQEDIAACAAMRDALCETPFHAAGQLPVVDLRRVMELNNFKFDQRWRNAIAEIEDKFADDPPAVELRALQKFRKNFLKVDVMDKLLFLEFLAAYTKFSCANLTKGGKKIDLRFAKLPIPDGDMWPVVIYRANALCDVSDKYSKALRSQGILFSTWARCLIDKPLPVGGSSGSHEAAAWASSLND